MSARRSSASVTIDGRASSNRRLAVPVTASAQLAVGDPLDNGFGWTTSLPLVVFIVLLILLALTGP
jgi:hypothetical protein